MSRLIVVVVAAGLTLAALAFSGQTASSTASYDLIASYVLDDLTGEISYSQQGALTGVVRCAASWQIQPSVVQPVADPRHIERIKVANALGKYVVESIANLFMTTTESVCLDSPTIGALPTCDYERAWEPQSTVASPTEIPAGWGRSGEVVAGLATGQRQDLPSEADLRAFNMLPRYAIGDIPFTGRLQFSDPVTGNYVRSSSYVAGYCLDEGISSGPCCRYDPSMHSLTFTARATGAPAGVPPVGPLGSWQQWVEVCNASCG